MQTLTSDALLEDAFAWLCRQRKGWPDSADVWDFRRHWAIEKVCLEREMRTGAYQLGLLRRTTLANGEDVDLWSARDALVMKTLTLVLQAVLPCTLTPKGKTDNPYSRVMPYIFYWKYILALLIFNFWKL